MMHSSVLFGISEKHQASTELLSVEGMQSYWGIQLANYPGFAASPGPATISF